MHKLTIFFIGTLFSFCGWAQQMPTLEYNQTYTSQSGFTITDIEFDNNGDIYVLGSALSDVEIGGVTFVAPSLVYASFYTSYFILCKFRKDSLLWSKQSTSIVTQSSLSVVYSSKIAIDSNNNVVISGSFCAENMHVDGQLFSTPFLTPGPNVNCFLIQFDSTGHLNWSKQFGKPNETSVINDIEYDPFGNLFVLGTCSDTMDFYGELHYSSYNGNAFLAKFDCSSIPVFVRYYHDVSSGAHLLKSSNGTNLTIDRNGFPVFLLGGGGGYYNQFNSYNDSGVLISCYPDGSIRFSNFFSDYVGEKILYDPSIRIQDLTTDRVGNIYLGGSFDSYYYDRLEGDKERSINWGKINQVGLGRWNDPTILVIKLNSKGEGEWAYQKIANRNQGETPITSINVNSCGNVFVCGALFGEFTNEGNPVWMIEESLTNPLSSPFDIYEATGSLISRYWWLPNQQSIFGTAYQVMHVNMMSCNDDTLDQFSYCPGSLFHIDYPLESGYTYNWSRDNIPLSSHTPILEDSIEGVYRVNAVNVNGCMVKSAPINVTKYDAPFLKLNDDTLYKCAYDSCLLNPVIISPTVQHYTWSLAGNSISVQSQIKVLKEGEYRLKIITDDGCSVEDSIRVVNSFYNPIISSSTFQYCEGDSAFVFLRPILPLVTLNWEYNHLPNGNHSDQLVVKNAGIYSLELIDSLLCKWKSNDLVLVENPKPVSVILIKKELEDCFGLRTSGILEVEGNFQSMIWNTGVSDRLLHVDEPGTYTVSVTDSFGCMSSSSYTVGIKESNLLKIPNLITPNGDLMNDEFEVLCTAKTISISVYNSWGETIYNNDNYKNDWGSSMNDGIYYYTINLFSNDHCEFNLKGWLYIVR